MKAGHGALGTRLTQQVATRKNQQVVTKKYHYMDILLLNLRNGVSFNSPKAETGPNFARK